MSIAGQKRKRHQSSSDSPSTSKSPLKSPELADVVTVREHHLGDQRPEQLQTRRSNLQRGAKDKVYAERLAAAGDSLAGFNGGFDIQRHKPVVLGSALSLGFTRGDRIHGYQFQNSTSDANNTSDIAAQKRAPRRQSKNINRNNNKRKDSRSVHTLTQKRREETPLGWPFTDPTILSERKSAPKSSNTAEKSQKISLPSSRLTSKPSLKEVESMEDRSDLPVLTRRHEEESLSDSFETMHQSGDLSRQDRRRELNSSGSSDTVMKRAKIECTSASSSEKITSNNDIACKLESDTKSTKQTPPSPNPKKVSYWKCNRCTLTNSSRRKKCEVCGNIRYVSMSSDGTFVLTDASGESVKKSAVDHICGEASEQGDFESDQLRESKATANYTIIDLKLSPPNVSQTEAPTWKSECTSSKSSPLSDTLTQTNDFFAIVSEPVSTRSRFKRLRLSQGMSQMKDGRNHSQQSLSPSACEEPRHLESQAARGIRGQQVQQCRNEKHDPNTNGFREWIAKRRSARHEKRRTKYSKIRERDYQETKEIKVRLTIDEVELNENTSNSSIRLFAVVSSSLLSRVRCSDDADCVESLTVPAHINASDHADLNARHPQLASLREYFDKSSCDKGTGEMKFVHVQLKFGGKRINKARLWAKIPYFSFNSGVTLQPAPSTHDDINSTADPQTMADSYTPKPSKPVDLKVKHAGGGGAISDSSFDVANTCVGYSEQCDSMVVSETEKSPQTSLNRAGFGKPDEPPSLCSNQRDEIPRELLQEQQHANGKIEDEQMLYTQARNLQDADENAGGIDTHHERQLDQPNHDISRDEDIDRDCLWEEINCDETTRIRKTACNSQNATKHDILVDRGSVVRARNTGERVLSRIASLECSLDPVTVNTGVVHSQQHQSYDFPSNMPEDMLIDAGGEQAKSTHAYTKNEIATFTSCTFGSVDCQQPFIPFTQQIMQFDYLSQASLGSDKSNTRSPSSCVNKLLGNRGEKERPSRKPNTIEKESTSGAITPPKLLFDVAINHSNAQGCLSYGGDGFLEQTPSSFQNKSTNPQINASILFLKNGNNRQLTHKVDTLDLASNQSVHLFQTAGKKVAINVTAESLSDANKLFSHDSYENAALCNVPVASASPAAVHNAQAVNTEDRKASDNSNAIDSSSDHAFPVFQTAEKRVAINVTAESLSKANKLLFDDFFENAASCSVPAASFLAAVHNAQVVNTEDEEGSGNSKPIDLPSDHSFRMFQSVGKKAAINGAAKSLSKGNMMFSYDFHENAASCSVRATSASPAAVHNAKAVNTDNEEAPSKSKLIDPPFDHAFPMFQTAGKKVAINVTAESLSKANMLFSRDFYENAASCSLRATSASPAAVHNSQAVNTEDRKASDNSKSIDPPSDHAFPMFRTAGKKVAINVTSESLSKANKLFSHDFYDNAASCSVPATSFPAAVHNAQAVNTEDRKASDNFKSIDSSSDHALGMFQTAGKKVAINITAESSKFNELFSHDFYESAAPFSVPATSFPAAMNDAQVLNTEDRKASDNSKSIDSSPENAFHMFHTAGKKVAFNVTAESLSKANRLLFDDFYENAAPCNVLAASDFPAAMNDAQFINTDNEDAPNNSMSIDPPSDHAFPMFQTAGKKVAINVTSESLSNANKLLFDDFYENAAPCSVRARSASPAAMNDAQVVNTMDKNASDNSKSIDPPSDDAFRMFQTAGKKVAINVTSESLSNANELFSHDFYENAAPCSDPATSAFDAPVKNAQFMNTDNEEVPHNSKSIDSSFDHAFRMFQTAGKKVAINVTSESLSKANKLFDNGVESQTVTIQSNYWSKKSDVEFLLGGIPDSHRLATRKHSAVKHDIMGNAEFPVASEKQDQSGTYHDISQISTVDTKFVSSMNVLGPPNSMFQTTEECLHRKNDSSEAIISDERDLELGEKTEVTVTPSIDISLLKQSVRRFRHNNRVRFSFCPTDRSILDASPFDQTTVSNEDHCDVFGGFSIKAKACDLTPSEVTGSFVTPDRRKRHLLDVFFGNSRANPTSKSVEAVFSENPKKEFVCAVPTSFSDKDEQIPRGSPPASNNMYTPLHKTCNMHDIQSEIKSKRLFHSSTVDVKTQSNVTTPQVCERIQTGSSEVNSHCRNKVKLGPVFKNKMTRSNCIENGVNEITLRVTSTNANLLRFSLSDGLPLFFFGQSDVPKVGHVGKVSDIKSWLIEQNCDASLFTDKWIQNHHRWIVWKLAAMERCFSKELGANYLVYSRVLRQIKERYDKELRLAKRPAVRKILNRDVSASMPVILCVSQILRFRLKAPTKEEVRIELTDGWYALPAALDSVLSQFVQMGKIKIGTKLMICNGQLLGSDEGVDPLDYSYSSSKRDCPVCLNITANSTRLARWNAKLGFVSPRNPQLRSSSILVKSLRDVFIDGGPIPAIDLVICKRYPRMFLEQGVGNRDESSLHLTEAEDAARQIEHDTRHQRTSERFADMAEKECSGELDDSAPQQWKEMQRSNIPLEYYDKLDAADKKVVDDWTRKRTLLLQTMVSKSVEDSMRDDPFTERNSKPYAKLRVKAFCHQEDTCNKPRRNNASLASELTIWRVSDEQYELVSEGSVVRMKNLVVKSEARPGILQLSANQETPMEALPKEQTCEQLTRSGYERRSPKSLIQINLMAKLSGVANIENEFDVVACIVKVQKVSENTTIAYLTDESGLMVKIKRDHKTENIDPFSLGNTALPTVVTFCNVRISSFDASEYCAVGAWGLLSCKSNHLMKTRYDDLNAWCTTKDGANCCKTVLDKINAGIPFGTDRTIKSKVCFGYIHCFEEQHSDISPASAINVIIDYGGVETISARFPIDLVQHAIRLFKKTSAENALRLNGLSLLSYLMSSNKMLLRFLIQEMPCYGGESPTLEVIDLSLASVNELSRLYLSKRKDEGAICRHIVSLTGDVCEDPNT